MRRASTCASVFLILLLGAGILTDTKPASDLRQFATVRFDCSTAPPARVR